MKKFLQMSAFVALLAVPWVTNAQDTLTICDDTVTSEYVPLCGLEASFIQNGQIIYPADSLTAMIGMEIKSMTFYCELGDSYSSGGYGDLGYWIVSLGTTTETTLSALDTTTPLTQVYSGHWAFIPPFSQFMQMTWIFDDGFVYTGGNLLVQFNHPVRIYGTRCIFSGIEAPGAAYTNPGGTNPGGTHSFLPKVSFVYDTPVSCRRVQSITASDVDSASMTINWVDTLNMGAGYTLTWWVDGGGITYNTITLGAGTDSYTLTGLSSNSLYYVTIAPNCADNTSAASRTASFHTACCVTPLPYSTSFEDNRYASGEMAPCWLVVQTGTSSGMEHQRETYPAAYASSLFMPIHHNPHTGEVYFAFESDSAEVEIAALPIIPDINGTKLSFWAYSTSPVSAILEVGVLEDDTVFVVKDTVRVTNSYAQYRVFYSSYMGTGNRMAMRFTPLGVGTSSIMIDDVEIEEFSECAPVSNLTEDTVTANTVALRWTPGDEETMWAIRIDGSDWIDVGEPSYEFAGLSPGTAYTFDVVALCSDTSEMRGITVRTECSDYLDAPLEYDFVSYDSVSQLPWCWSPLETVDFVGDGYGSHYPQVSMQLLFRARNAEDCSVVLPRIGNLSPNGIKVEVEARVQNGITTRLYFGYVTHPDSANTFVALDSIMSTTKQSYVFNTSSVENVDDLWLAFRCSTISNNNRAYIYRLRISHYSTCTLPDAVVIDSLTYNSVGLSWNATGADAYQVAVSTATNLVNVSEDDIHEPDASVDTAMVVTGLTPRTNYNVWLRAICGNDTSEWLQGPSIYTYCGEVYCPLVVEMADGYGDGWNGNAINVNVNGLLATSFTIDNGFTGVGTFAVCDSDDVVLTWVQGQYPVETSFTVKRAGAVLTQGQGADPNTSVPLSTGDTIAMFIGCPSCLVVDNVAILDTATTTNSMTIHWTPSGETDSIWAVMLNDSILSTTVTDTTYTFTGLTANMPYTFGVATVCSDTNISSFVTLQGITACAVVCDMYVSIGGLVDQYWNAWSFAGIGVDVYQNGVRRASISPDYSYSSIATPETYPASVCAGDSVQLVYRAHSWSYGRPDALAVASYVVLSGNGDTLGSGVNMNSYVDGDILEQVMVSCPNCITPTNLHMVSATTSSMTLGWTDVTPATIWRVLVNDGDTIVSYDVTSNPCTITGLQPAAFYYVSLAAVCNDGDTTNYTIPVRMATECAPVTLPWDYAVHIDMLGVSGEMPLCWYAPESFTYGSITYPSVLGSSFYIAVEDGIGNNAMVASPRIPEAGNDLYVRFHAQGCSGTLAQAGVITDVNDPTTFIPVITVPDREDDYEFFTEGIAGLTSNDTVHIAFRNSTTAGFGELKVYSIHVQKAPACHRPDSVAISNVTTDGVTLTWPNTGAARYEVSIGDTIYSVTTNTVTLTGLAAGTNYTFSLVGICSDTSIALRGGFVTECPVVYTLPFTENFDSYAQYGMPMPNCWTRKNLSPDNRGNQTPYISTDDYYAHSGQASLLFCGSANNHPMAVTPALTGAAINSLYVSFWGYCASAGFVAGLMTDPDDDSTFIPMINVATPTSYTQYTFYTDSIADTSSVYYFAIRIDNGSNYGIFVMDDLEIRHYPACAEDFSSVRVGDITVDSATVYFTPGLGHNVGADYTVNVMNAEGLVVATATAAASPIVVGGLTESTTYTATVSINCGGSVNATSNAVVFTTRCTTDATSTIENSNSDLNAFIPINNYYKHSASQQIYRASELGRAANITGVAFNYVYNVPLYGFSSKIYMTHITDTLVGGTWVNPATMELVYEGYLDCQNGWNEFLFNTPFAYNGVDNVLMMVVADSTNHTGGYRFKSHYVGDGATILFENNNVAYIYGVMSTNENTYNIPYRNDAIFYTCVNCEQPVFTDTVINETSITVTYSGGTDSYEVAFVSGTLVDFEDTVVTMTPYVNSDTVYTINGLTGFTQYTFGVRGVCGEFHSPWAIMTVTTLSPCAVPTNVAVTDPSYDGATVSWTIGEAETEWQVRVFCASPLYDDTIDVTGTPSTTIHGLANDAVFSVAVRAVCDVDWVSPWSDTVTLTPANCPQVTGVGASNVTATTATISWTSTDAASYEIEYGNRGFTQGTGTTVTATTNSVNLTGLEEETNYDVYVRSVCVEGVTSVWSAKYTFTTPQSEGIDDVAGSNVTLFPNPASEMVTVAGLEGESTVTVVDLNGREVYKATANGSVTIDVSGYAKGIYFVRVTGESTTAIRKLIVK